MDRGASGASRQRWMKHIFARDRITDDSGGQAESQRP